MKSPHPKLYTQGVQSFQFQQSNKILDALYHEITALKPALMPIQEKDGRRYSYKS
jgi:hypothetical protein